MCLANTSPTELLSTMINQDKKDKQNELNVREKIAVFMIATALGFAFTVIVIKFFMWVLGR
jgi:hypothetical protein